MRSDTGFPHASHGIGCGDFRGGVPVRPRAAWQRGHSPATSWSVKRSPHFRSPRTIPPTPAPAAHGAWGGTTPTTGAITSPPTIHRAARPARQPVVRGVSSTRTGVGSCPKTWAWAVRVTEEVPDTVYSRVKDRGVVEVAAGGSPLYVVLRASRSQWVAGGRPTRTQCAAALDPERDRLLACHSTRVSAGCGGVSP